MLIENASIIVKFRKIIHKLTVQHFSYFAVCNNDNFMFIWMARTEGLHN